MKFNITDTEREAVLRNVATAYKNKNPSSIEDDDAGLAVARRCVEILARSIHRQHAEPIRGLKIFEVVDECLRLNLIDETTKKDMDIVRKAGSFGIHDDEVYASTRAAAWAAFARIVEQAKKYPEQSGTSEPKRPPTDYVEPPRRYIPTRAIPQNPIKQKSSDGFFASLFTLVAIFVGSQLLGYFLIELGRPWVENPASPDSFGEFIGIFILAIIGGVLCIIGILLLIPTTAFEILTDIEITP